MLICFVLPIILVGPGFLAFQVVKSSNRTNETNGYLTTTEFGSTKFFQMYFIIVLLFESVIAVVILLVLNVISLVRLKNQLAVVRNDVSYQTIKVQITKLIILLTFICVLTRTIDLAITIIVRLNMSALNLTNESDFFLLLSRSVAYFQLLLAHAFDGVFYYSYDNLLKSAALKMLRKCRRKISSMSKFLPF